MATLVFFHAHPDDEAIATGGTMAAAAAAGHRVILVLATRGELGEVAEDFLDEGETLGDRRFREAQAAAEVLGVSRVAFLGYRDSGMMGEATNDDAEAFWQADVEEAAGRLEALLREEGAEVLVAYDDHGGYGHPDHIQVHRVGIRAAELAETPRVFESTMNRDAIRESMLAAPPDASTDIEGMPTEEEIAQLGSADADITTAVDVRAHIETKRAAMVAHASQISEESFFLAMPREVFDQAFGTEWYIRRGVTTPVEAKETSLLA